MVYMDFPTYRNCELGTLNMGYSQLICWFEIDSVFTPTIMVTTFLLCCLRDTVYIHFAESHLGFRGRAIIFLTALLAFHPYLAVSSIKLTTSTVSSFILCFFIVSRVHLKTKGLYSQLILIPLFLVRNSFLSFSIVFLFGSFFISLIRKKTKELFLSGLVLVLILFLYQLNDRDYVTLIMTIKNDYSFNSIFDYFANQIDNTFFSLLMASILVFLSHLVMILGFRETFYVQGISWFDSFSLLKLAEVVGGVILLIFHSLGFIGLMKIRALDLLLKVSLIFTIFPGFLFVSHIRYLYPIIPLLLIGFTYYTMQHNIIRNFFEASVRKKSFKKGY